MQTNITNNFDISKVFNRDYINVWKMDTSHKSVLLKFIDNSTKNADGIVFEKNGLFGIDGKPRYDINVFEGDVLKKQIKNRADSTTRQYIEVLCFYGIIDIPTIRDSKEKMIKSISEKKISFKNGHEYIEVYLDKEYERILSNIKEFLKLEESDFLWVNTFSILSLMELSLNYFSSTQNYSRESLEEFAYAYDNQYKKIFFKKNSKSISKENIGDLWNEIKLTSYMIPFYTNIFIDLNANSNFDRKEFQFGEFENRAENYGYLGEEIVYKYLSFKFSDAKIYHASKENKYSNHDIKVDDKYYVEVKTKMTSTKNKKTFQMSSNEYKLLDTETDLYYLYYVNKIPKGEEYIKLWSSIFDNMNIESLIKNYNIEISILNGKELKESFSFSPKGFWVSEQ